MRAVTKSEYMLTTHLYCVSICNINTKTAAVPGLGALAPPPAPPCPTVKGHQSPAVNTEKPGSHVMIEILRNIPAAAAGKAV